MGSFSICLPSAFDGGQGQLSPGDHIISSYGYANECFEWIQRMAEQLFLMEATHIPRASGYFE